mmetsp:Transcript_6904/g.28270  ORF Transcript_6904/g.28270 Transcript_6904/m.28270 type:complete len:202 (-) Transcript_6904:632-1237(-)
MGLVVQVHGGAAILLVNFVDGRVELLGQCLQRQCCHALLALLHRGGASNDRSVEPLVASPSERKLQRREAPLGRQLGIRASRLNRQGIEVSRLKILALVVTPIARVATLRIFGKLLWVVVLARQNPPCQAAVRQAHDAKSVARLERVGLVDPVCERKVVLQRHGAWHAEAVARGAENGHAVRVLVAQAPVFNEAELEQAPD